MLDAATVGAEATVGSGVGTEGAAGAGAAVAALTRCDDTVSAT